MDTKEKSIPLRETTDADYIMFNHTVLSAYRDLLELKNLGCQDWEIKAKELELAVFEKVNNNYKTNYASGEYEYLIDTCPTNFRHKNICEGTQRLNTLQGLLVEPFADKVKNKLNIKSNENIKNSLQHPTFSAKEELEQILDKQWDESGMAELKKYAIGEKEQLLTNSYIDCSKEGFSKQINTPYWVVDHLRNAVAHKRLMVEPLNIDNEKQCDLVTHIRFRDDFVFNYKFEKLHKNKNKAESLSLAKRKISEIIGYDIEPNLNIKSGDYIFGNDNKYFAFPEKFEITIRWEDIEQIIQEIYSYINLLSLYIDNTKEGE